MIERLRLVNFKSHADTTIAPGRLTALVGPNGAGKTGVLQALEVMIDLANHAISDVFEDGVLFNEYLRREQQKLELELRGKTQGPASKEWLAWFERSNQGDKWQYYGNAHWGLNKQPGFEPVAFQDIPFWDFRQTLGDIALMKMFGKHLHLPSYRPEIPPRLDADGTGLASVVSYLKGNDRFEPVLAALQAIVPAVKAVRIEPAKVRVKENRSIKIDDKDISYESDREMSGQALVFDFVHARNIPASQVSEGTLMALALLTLLYSPECPSLVLIDDIETALHPKAQRELVVQLRKLLDLRPELQILFTTHSVYMVDELTPEEIWVLAVDAEGISHARQMSDHPDARRSLEVLTTGEFWGAEGEAWVLEHGKQPA
jgi:predicted ATPase